MNTDDMAESRAILDKIRGVQTPPGGGQTPPPVDDPPKPADNDGMERRVTALEEAVKTIRDDVKAIKFNLWAGILAIWLSVIGMGFIIQQMTVSTFQGAAEVARASLPPASTPPAIIINVPPAVGATEPQPLPGPGTR